MYSEFKGVEMMCKLENDKRGVIDVVLPAYNPHFNWQNGVIKSFNTLKSEYVNYDFNLHIATDGSTRGYEPNVRDQLLKAIPNVSIVDSDKNHGKGYALRSAVNECHGDWIVYVDYDFPYTEVSVDNVIKALSEGADVVVALRSDSYQKNLPTFRRFLSEMSHLFNRIILMMPIADTQGGMKGFNQKGREIFLSTTIDTFLFDTQFIKKSLRTKGISVKCVDAKIKDGLNVSAMGIKVLFREMKNIKELWR